jgi:MFS family permease
MQAAGQLDLAQGSWLASANYLGYFVGALLAARIAIEPRTLVRVGVMSIALLTAAMAWTDSFAGWLLLRAASGVLSACVLVGTSAWCLAELSRAGKSAWAGMVYAGVGGGIALAGLYCLGGVRLHAAPGALWMQLGLVAALCGGVVLLLARRGPAVVAAVAAPVAVPASTTLATGANRPASGSQPSTQRTLVTVYGIFGLGYILPATFLPAMARTVLDDPAVFGWAWPVFGAAAALSTVLVATLFARVDRVRLWVACQLLMAVGTGLPGLMPSTATVLASALLVGGTFMVVTMVGLQEARARGGAAATALLGSMTASFALGQIAGPLGSALLGRIFGGDLLGMRVALLLAAALLAASALWLRHDNAKGYPSSTASRATT